MRDQRGDASAASHLCLLVRCPETPEKYLVDVGFGGSMIRPIALQEDQHDQPPFKLGLTRLEDRYWRFWEDSGDGEFSFDFMENAASEASLAAKCSFLQSDPASSFVLNLVAQQRSRNRHWTLRGRVFSVVEAGDKKTRIVESPGELLHLLASEYRLVVPEIAGLWPRIVARHDQVFGDGALAAAEKN
jgi:N-hydroxyarylamine O-acetyltransferase